MIDKEPNLKAAVSRLALALDGDAGDDDPLSVARRIFASGDVEGALDRALDAVKAASGDEEREAARELCVTIIDAHGPGQGRCGRGRSSRRALLIILCAEEASRAQAACSALLAGAMPASRARAS